MSLRFCIPITRDVTVKTNHLGTKTPKMRMTKDFRSRSHRYKDHRCTLGPWSRRLTVAIRLQHCFLNRLSILCHSKVHPTRTAMSGTESIMLSGPHILLHKICRPYMRCGNSARTGALKWTKYHGAMLPDTACPWMNLSCRNW